jgi:predicted DNA-binding transcriptional regulator AlpA
VSVTPSRRAVGSNLLHSREYFGQQSAALSRVLRSLATTFGRASFCRVVEPLGPDWWTIQQVAQYLGIRQSTARAYVARQKMPAPDGYVGSTAVWRRSTIEEWAARRPRKGKPS